MKKSYIKPEITAIDVRVVNMLAASDRKIYEETATSSGPKGIVGDDNGDTYSRETIKSPGVWEEW